MFNLKFAAMKYRKKCLLSTSVAFYLILFLTGCTEDDSPTPVLANGTVAGLVKDERGFVYRQVTLRLDNGKEDTTDSDGYYQLDDVPVGNYQLTSTVPLGSQSIGDNPRSLTVSEAVTTVEDFTFEPMQVQASLVVGDTDPLTEVLTAQSTVPSNSDDLLYTPLIFEQPLGQLSPILAPDGHQITLGEWQTAQGIARVFCDNSISKYRLEFSGLIPNGVYTLWNFILNKQKLPTNSLDMVADVVAAGSLGDNGSNVMIASASGEATLDVDVSPGTLSMFGTQSSCAITSSPGFILVVNYHIDGNTHGGTPGPDKDDVAHLLIYY